MKLRTLIEKSIYKNGKASSSRIFSYVMMLVIFMLGLTHVSTEIGNAIFSWKDDKVHVPSINSISITALWLAHQLTLLGIYKRSEVNIPKIVTNKDEDKNQINS
jgi:cobalamin biosynthesis protein CobD/CbiB